MVGDKAIPVAGDKAIPVAGDKAIPVAGDKAIPVAGDKTIQIGFAVGKSSESCARGMRRDSMSNRAAATTGS
jgi:hypothetical protein